MYYKHHKMLKKKANCFTFAFISDILYPGKDAGEVFVMAQVLVNFRLEEEDKKGMEEVCRDLGMSMSTAFTIFAKKMRRERRIPFEVSIDPFYSDSNISYLNKVLSEIDSGKAKLAEHPLIEDERKFKRLVEPEN